MSGTTLSIPDLTMGRRCSLVKQLIRAEDPGYAKRLSATSPLPYFALSNLLTYFSHDVPTLSLIQHIFDYLFSRPPIAIVYLVTVMILVRKDEVETLYQSGDEGMLHALLCNLPDLVDDIEMPTPPKQLTMDALPETPPLSKSWDDTKSEATEDLSASQAWTSGSVGTSVMTQSWTTAASASTAASESSMPSPGTSPTLPPVVLSPSTEPPRLDLNIDSALEFPPLDPGSPVSRNSSAADEKGPIEAAVASSVVDVASVLRLLKQPLVLTALLRQADELYQRHPMSSIQTASIMGPQSVIFTWCETGHKPASPDTKGTGATTGVHWESAGSHLVSDDMAEKMTLHPELVVRPWRDEDEEEAEREARASRQKRETGRKQSTGRNDPGIFGAITGDKGSVIVVGGIVVVVALGVVIASYGKNGEWRKWISRSSWLSRSPSAGGY